MSELVRKTRQPFRLRERWQFEILVGTVVALLAFSVFGIAFPKKEQLRYDDGNLVYVGDVQSNRFNGHGQLTYANGDRYEGDFVNGVFNGQGTFTSHQGWQYKGAFKDGKPHGKGRLETANKAVFKGRFKQGVYQE